MPEWREMVQKAQGGDLDAFDALVAQFRDMAVGYAYSLLRDFALAEDAAQEAFVQAYRDLASLRSAEAFPAWFRRIVFKSCDRLTRRKRLATVALEAAAEAPAQAPDALEEIAARQESDAVMRAVGGLPEHERAAVTLFYINGYSVSEVGEFLEASEAAVKSRLHSARRKLKERMLPMVQEALHRRAPGAAFNQRVRQVLESVPLVSFELHRLEQKDGLPRCPESMSFPSCLRAFLEYRGDDLGYEKIEAHGREWRLDNTYVHLMGTTGAAFRLAWAPGWRRDGPDQLEGCRYGIESAGYDYEIVRKEPGRDNEAYFRERIVESIRDRGNPVIATGVVGPPLACLVTGFDEGGEVLIGWSFFQNIDELKGDIEYEPSGCFRKRRWFEDAGQLIVLGERRQRPPLETVYRDALRRTAGIASTPAVGEFHNGFAAYEAWAAALADNAVDPELRYHVHHETVGKLAECRWYAHNFLRRIVAAGGAKELLRAADCFDAQHTLMWQVWGLAGGIGDDPEHARRFADPAVRRQAAALILEARQKDMEAIRTIEASLG